MKFSRNKIDRKWLLGISEFHSFFVVESLQTSCLTGFLENLNFFFIVKTSYRDIATLYRFKTYMGVGKIVFEKESGYYYVCRESYLYEKIIKFFSGNPLLTSKRIEYERFRYVLHKKYCNEISCSNLNYMNLYISRYCVCYKNLTCCLKKCIEDKKNKSIAKAFFYLQTRIFLLFLYFLKDKVRLLS